MGWTTLQGGDLSVVVGDNEAGDGPHAAHKAGYNGVWSLTHAHQSRNCFVPFYAGLNLEHIMDELFMSADGGDAYEPRHAPMTLARLSDAAASLTQAATPLTGSSFFFRSSSA